MEDYISVCDWWFKMMKGLIKTNPPCSWWWHTLTASELVSTHFAIIVEVRVKAHTVPPGGLQVDQRGGVGVVLGEIHIKLKAAVGVGCVGWACDENLKHRGEVMKRKHWEGYESHSWRGASLKTGGHTDNRKYKLSEVQRAVYQGELVATLSQAYSRPQQCD